eukprot:Blabericola_migrator_1__13026@NODE_872_length_6202_cov_28_273513_g616_i0_p3_GENE_NODE_872_length_6202_cov_28_273513_g616_i0NODE_872_length_6202_cov_28_273513_g616_i0_p3_ORF_typecomplete_len427_score87_11XRCC4/PF06632_12/1_1e08Pox_A_type_inc/PF04508_12/0_11Glyco_hydro2_C5/PF18565_1/0_8_NODE_872_length_6202_cov_28_273513_g616_i05881868
MSKPRGLLNLSLPTLDTLFDVGFATQQDYLYELNAAAASTRETHESGFGSSDIRVEQLIDGLTKLNEETFCIVDLLLKRPTHDDTSPVGPSRKKRMLNFPSSHIANKARVQDVPPVSRIAVLAKWTEDFNHQVKKSKLEQAEEKVGDKDPEQDASQQGIADNGIEDVLFVTIEVYDGTGVWKGEVQSSSLRSLDYDSVCHLFRFLVYGKLLESQSRKSVSFKVTGYFEQHGMSNNEAKLHIYYQDRNVLIDNGIALTKSSEANEDFISRLFVAAYKRQILSQSLMTNMLYSLRTLQDSCLELAKASEKSSAALQQSHKQFLSKVLALLNSKKRRIEELETQLTRQGRQTDLIPEVEQPVKASPSNKTRLRAKAKPRAKVRPIRKKSTPVDDVPSTKFFEAGLESSVEVEIPEQPNLFSGWDSSDED